jgi:hypothetical protein
MSNPNGKPEKRESGGEKREIVKSGKAKREFGSDSPKVAQGSARYP